MFKFIYVNQVIHMVILVDNVDKFVHNLIIGGFADFLSCGKLFGKFFTYPPWFDKFCAYCHNGILGLLIPSSACFQPFSKYVRKVSKKLRSFLTMRIGSKLFLLIRQIFILQQSFLTDQL